MSHAEHEAGAGLPGVVRPAGRAPVRTRRPLSIRARLVGLVLTLLVPALLVAGVLLWSLQRQVHQTQDRQLAATSRSLALMVDGRISEQVATLDALAVSVPLAHGDWAGFAAQARTALKGSDSWVVAQGPDGRQAVNTFPGVGPRPPSPGPKVGEPIWSGRRRGAQVSNLVWGPVSRQRVIVVMKPIVLADGRAARLSVVTPATSFNKLLARQELPAGWTAVILDGQQRVVGRSREGQKFVGARHTPTRESAARAAVGHGVVHALTLDGVPGIVAYDRIAGYGWTTAVAMPQDDALGPAQQPLLLGVVLGAVLLLAAILLALRMGRRIAEPVETVARAASEWVAGGAARFPAATGLTETDGLSRAFASALQAVEQRDQRQKLLMNELNHRVKNTLATVQAVAMHTRAGAASTEDYHAALEGRVIAMSRAHEILTRTAWEGAELGVLARETLDAFAGPRLRIEGPPAQVAPTDALNLALILYELATNAAKHGALSQLGGQVVLSWKTLDGHVRVSWVETGGPSVRPPTRKGFGSRLIERATRDLQPSAFSFSPEGVRCELTVPTRSG